MELRPGICEREIRRVIDWAAESENFLPGCCERNSRFTIVTRQWSEEYADREVLRGKYKSATVLLLK
ncbi:hypothetical protein Nepgr_013627 [Nepenthes gracilis]|uniref:Uncharacterized protein n=1 Tax=Nepenthes gracilis TaxID=150966 RepID=A0AAD3SK41_NEPGR|nr:hypothetical protein Nepgr_013627 [Nepenthes gracilis]